MKELKINKGIELMLRGAKPKEKKSKPSNGLTFTKSFTLRKRRVYFNFEFLWDKET